jgi:hypothetical protein
MGSMGTYVCGTYERFKNIMKGLRAMYVVIEKFFDDQGAEIGELVIESNELNFKVVTYGNAFDDDGNRRSTDIKWFTSEGGALRYLLSLTLKEGKHETIEALLEGLGEIRDYIQEKTAFVVAARELKKKKVTV